MSLRVSREATNRAGRQAEPVKPVKRERAAVPFTRSVPVLDGSSRQEQADKWLRMAGAMDQALNRMREAWKMVDRLCELHKESQCYCRPENWKPLQDEIAAVAVILRVGLKARGPR